MKKKSKNSYHEKAEPSFNNLVQMKNIDSEWRDPKYYLGEEDADTEWNNYKKRARKTFLYTKSYLDFLLDSSLILLGRTGTGKTAIFRFIEDGITNKDFEAYNDRIQSFNHVLKIDFNLIVCELIQTDSIQENSIITAQLDQVITCLINTVIMKKLFLLYGKDVGKATRIEKYLGEKGVLETEKGESFIAKLFSKIYENINNTEIKDALGVVCSIKDVYREVHTVSYSEALDEVYELLDDKKILVLIDSLNEYNINDIRVLKVIKSLISVCFNYHNNKSNVEKKSIYMKIALPSEIYKRLLDTLPGKQQGNTITIQWRFKDLIIFIALRLYSWCEEYKKEGFDFHKKYNIEDFYYKNDNAFETAKKLIYEILPRTCKTSLNFELDTLAYCVKHTTRKPRELMMIFNSFIDVIIDKRDKLYFIKNPDEIRNIIHSTQEAMIKSCLSMYAYNGLIN